MLVKMIPAWKCHYSKTPLYRTIILSDHQLFDLSFTCFIPVYFFTTTTTTFWWWVKMFLIWNLEHMFLSLRKEGTQRKKIRPNPTLSLLSTHLLISLFLSLSPSLSLTLSLSLFLSLWAHADLHKHFLLSHVLPPICLCLSVRAYVSLDSFEFFPPFPPPTFLLLFKHIHSFSPTHHFLLHGYMHQAPTHPPSTHIDIINSPSKSSLPHYYYDSHVLQASCKTQRGIFFIISAMSEPHGSQK